MVGEERIQLQGGDRVFGQWGLFHDANAVDHDIGLDTSDHLGDSREAGGINPLMQQASRQLWAYGDLPSAPSNRYMRLMARRKVHPQAVAKHSRAAKDQNAHAQP